MTDFTANESSKKPGVVIFAAILNFISAAVAAFFLVVSVLGLIFGSAIAFSDAVARQVSQYAPAGSSYGVAFVFVFLALFSAIFLFLFLAVGLGLLRGRRFAWYTQVTLSVLGLFGFPFWTIVNAILLVFFFQAPVRNYFKV